MAEQQFQVIPVFRIFDVDKAKAFYLDFLGLSVDWEHRFEDDMPLYMQVSLGTLKLHLTEHHGDCCPGSTAYVQTADLDKYHGEIAAKYYPFFRPSIEPVPWGRLMEVKDPFGNRIRFTGP